MFLLDKQRGGSAASGWVWGIALTLAVGSVSANASATGIEADVSTPLPSTAPAGVGESTPAINQTSSEPDLKSGQPDQDTTNTSSSVAEEAPSARLPADPPSTLSDDADYAAHWVIDNADNHGQPFAIVDKKGAHIYVFASTGKLAGDSSVLLGLAAGDRTIPGIARRTPASLTPGERTTPAGRFASEPGHNIKGEDIVWFDYDASLAIHRLRPAPANERRADRLASSNSDDKRISFGCIVVPVAFYDTVVSPALGRGRGVVYVLPETRTVRDLFGSIELSRR